MYVTTSVTYKPEVRIDLLTFIQIVNNFALEPYSNLFSILNLFMNRYVCQIQFNYEDLEEIFAGGQGSFGVY